MITTCHGAWCQGRHRRLGNFACFPSSWRLIVGISTNRNTNKIFLWIGSVPAYTSIGLIVPHWRKASTCFLGPISDRPVLEGDHGIPAAVSWPIRNYGTGCSKRQVSETGRKHPLGGRQGHSEIQICRNVHSGLDRGRQLNVDLVLRLRQSDGLHRADQQSHDRNRSLILGRVT
jgi:hypothetical protein